MMFTTTRITVAACATMLALLIAGPASASNYVTVHNEATGLSCSNLNASHSSGGCPVHAEGLIEFRVDLGIFGELHEALCDVEFDMRVGGTREIAVDDQELYNSSPGTDANCTGANPVMTECDLPWEGSGEKVFFFGHTLRMTSNLCIDPSESGGLPCIGVIAYDLVENEGTESYAITFNNASVEQCEIDMDVAIEVQPGSGDTQLHL